MAPMLPTASTPPYSRLAGLSLVSDDANGTVYPDEEERCRKRNANRGSVHNSARLPRYQLISEASAEQKDSGENKIAQGFNLLHW